MNPSNVTAYHGTASAFERFCRTEPRDHPSAVGIWFASHEDVAEGFARSSIRFRDDVPRIVTAGFRVSRPIVFERYADFLEAYRDMRCDVRAMRRTMLRCGHDVVVIVTSNTDGLPVRTDYAVLDPDAIVITGSRTLMGEGNDGKASRTSESRGRKKCDA